MSGPIGKVGQPGNRNGSAINGKGTNNPAGRRSVTKALREAGFDPDSLCAEVIQKTIEGFRTLDAGDKDEGASWRWCMDKAWILVNLPAKPIEQAEPPDLTEAEYQEELMQLAKEQVAKLSPEERFKWLSAGTEPGTVQ